MSEDFALGTKVGRETTGIHSRVYSVSPLTPTSSRPSNFVSERTGAFVVDFVK